jgi:hypothetical protein
MDGHGRVFTPENLIVVREMAARGCSARKIAEVIGSTPSSVRVKCSQQKIKLKRGRGPGRPSNGHFGGPEDSRVRVVAYLPEQIYALLVQRALELRKPPSLLASMLLSAIATSELYRAVLDDATRPGCGGIE